LPLIYLPGIWSLIKDKTRGRGVVDAGRDEEEEEPVFPPERFFPKESQDSPQVNNMGLRKL